MSEKKQQAVQFDVKKLLENKQYVAIGAFAIAAIAVALISVLVLKISVVPVCVILILEAGIAACLNNEQIWLHGAVLLIEVIAGILAKQIVFIILAGAIYVAAIFALKYWKES